MLEDEICSSERDKALNQADHILSEWGANENIGQLIELLGIPQKRGGRRLEKTFVREIALASSVFAYVEAGEKPAQAKKLTASQYSADMREVERAYAGWRERIAEPLQWGIVYLDFPTT